MDRFKFFFGGEGWVALLRGLQRHATVPYSVSQDSCGCVLCLKATEMEIEAKVRTMPLEQRVRLRRALTPEDPTLAWHLSQEVFQQHVIWKSIKIFHLWDPILQHCFATPWPGETTA